MRKFRFNLQRVLDYRRTIEDALLTELAAIQGELERESSRLAELVQARDTFRQQMREHLAGGDPEDIRRAHSYLQQLGKQVSAQQANVRRIKDRKERKTDEVIEAARERKVLERLREQKVVQHRRETERQEQNFLDDLACIRYTNEARGNGE